MTNHIWTFLTTGIVTESSPHSLRLSPIKMKIILYSLLLAGAVRAFRVSKVTPKEIRVKEGHPFKIICTTDDWYEVSLTTL